MGFLSDLIGKALGDGISKGISKAVSSSAEKAIKPATDKWANETAKSINSAAETMEQYNKEVEANSTTASSNLEEAMNNLAAASIYNTALVNFPKWTYSSIEEVQTSEEDEYVCIMVGMKIEDEMTEKYQEVLKQNGFTGNWQIMEKTIDGKVHKIDFSFVMDQFINYYIFK